MGTTRATVKGDAGVTVAEVIIALFVITVGLLALIATMPLSTSLIGTANVQTTATFLGQQRMEQIKNVQWTAAPAVDDLGGAGSSGTAAVAQWPDEGYATIGGYPGFRRQVRITDCSVLACSGIPTGTVSIDTLRRVTVTVFFRALSGVGTASANEEPVQLVTLIARRP
jgi:Tfp pilus assembly protein PilV